MRVRGDLGEPNAQSPDGLVREDGKGRFPFRSRGNVPSTRPASDLDALASSGGVNGFVLALSHWTGNRAGEENFSRFSALPQVEPSVAKGTEGKLSQRRFAIRTLIWRQNRGSVWKPVVNKLDERTCSNTLKSDIAA